jgi:hypothetical protein
MPNYMYADSVEFPIQRDFIDLLERYADMAIEGVPCQQQIIDLKKRLVTLEAEETSKLSRIDRYAGNVTSSVAEVTAGFKDDDLERVSEGIKAAIKTQVGDFRDSKRKQFEDQLKVLRADLKKRQASLLSVLGEFLYYDPMEVGVMEVTAELKDKSYEAQLTVRSESGIAYSFNLDFGEKELKVEDLIKKTVKTPAVMKATMLSKEKKPRFVEINDWVLAEGEYSSNGETSLRAVLQRDPDDAESPKLDMELRPGETKIQCLNYVDEEGQRTDILKDEQLSKHVDRTMDELSKYLLAHFFAATSRKKEILSASIGDRSIVEDDLVDEFVEKLAAEYGPIVRAIRERGLVDNELNLKAEDLEGKRTEIYLKIDEYKEKMSAIPQGAEICTILGLD